MITWAESLDERRKTRNEKTKSEKREARSEKRNLVCFSLVVKNIYNQTFSHKVLLHWFLTNCNFSKGILPAFFVQFYFPLPTYVLCFVLSIG